jgi:DNA-binding beta-propeller fold protein YncE
MGAGRGGHFGQDRDISKPREDCMTAKDFTARLCIGAALAAALVSGGVATAAPATYAVTAHIPGPDGRWDYVSFDPVKRRVYLSRADGLAFVDADTGKLTAHLADGQRTHEPLPLPGGERLLLTNGATGTASLLDTSTGALIASIPAGDKPDGAVFEAKTGLVLITSHSGVMAVIDPKAAAPAGSVTVGGSLEFAAADGKGHVYVDVEDQNLIAAIDVKARQVTARYPLAGCEGPGGLAYDAKLDLLIASCGNNVAKVISAATGREVASLTIGKGPDAVFVDEGRRLAFIPCGRDGVLEVISLADPKHIAVAQTVTTQPGARTGAVDPKTGVVYLPTATYTLQGGIPTVTPGTFQVLVVSPG